MAAGAKPELSTTADLGIRTWPLTHPPSCALCLSVCIGAHGTLDTWGLGTFPLSAVMFQFHSCPVKAPDPLIGIAMPVL